MKKNIAFIFTNYNNSVVTINAVKSIFKCNLPKDVYIKIIVVDNCSTPPEKKLLESIVKKFNIVKIIYLKNNIGYFKGLNEGINNLGSEFYDFVVIGNNDLSFGKNFIHSVYENYHLFKKYPVISPNIIRIDGFHQNPHVTRPVSKFRRFMYEIYFSNYYLSKIILIIANLTRKYTQRGDEKSHNKAGEIIEGYGACYLLGPIFFEEFDRLLAPTFLMGEEFFLYYQLHQKNYKIYYEPKIQVSHLDHATVSKLPSKKFWRLSKESHKIHKQYLKKLS